MTDIKLRDLPTVPCVSIIPAPDDMLVYFDRGVLADYDQQLSVSVLCLGLDEAGVIHPLIFAYGSFRSVLGVLNPEPSAGQRIAWTSIGEKAL